MMREIVLDTETTGLSPKDGHRVIEIGCVELINHLPTGKTFHAYINPLRDVPAEASAISGLTTEFLKDYPIFVKVVEPFLDFIEDSPLVIHNARFDMMFLNAELNRLCRPTLPVTRAIDTLQVARKKFPGSPASLDALCRRFQIDLSSRTKHGALVDSELLAKVYLELLGGRQVAFKFQTEGAEDAAATSLGSTETTVLPRNVRSPRSFPLSTQEQEAHEAFIDTFKNPLWRA